MRLSGARWRRRSLGTWLVLSCALLALGIYIAFDVLDLDGSDFCSWPLKNPLAVNPPQGDAELFLAQGLPSPEGLGLAALPPALQFAPDPAKLRLRTAPSIFTARPSRFHLSGQARRGISSRTRTSPSGDPV